jgi:hypothetical protein
MVSLSPGRRRDGQVPRRGPDHVRPACPRGARDGPDDESPQASTSCQPGRTTRRSPDDAIAVPTPKTRYEGIYTVVWSVPSSTLKPMVGPSTFSVFSAARFTAVPRLVVDRDPVVVTVYTVAKMRSAAGPFVRTSAGSVRQCAAESGSARANVWSRERSEPANCPSRRRGLPASAVVSRSSAAPVRRKDGLDPVPAGRVRCTRERGRRCSIPPTVTRAPKGPDLADERGPGSQRHCQDVNVRFGDSHQDLGAGKGGAPAADVRMGATCKREPLKLVTARLRNPHSRGIAPAELVPGRF